METVKFVIGMTATSIVAGCLVGLLLGQMF
jgi:hypothetical protein